MVTGTRLGSRYITGTLVCGYMCGCYREIAMQRIINVWLLKLVVVKLAYVIKVRVLQQQN